MSTHSSVKSLWAACALGLVAPAQALLPEQEERARILAESQHFEQTIQNQKVVFEDPVLDTYLQGVLDRLYPDQVGKLRVRAYRSSDFNAFAIASGSIYFNIGALLRLDNEAQLATILGHEGAHVTQDHIYRFTRRMKATMPFAIVAGAALGDPNLGAIVGVSTISGFSRDNEREADEVGFDRMLKAGYSGSEGAIIWARLARELAVAKEKQGAYFFASHPRIKERQATLESLAAKAGGVAGETNTDMFLATTLNARIAALEELHSRGNGKLLVLLLDEEKRLDKFPPQYRYYLAEGYRLRAAIGDTEKAEAAYLQTIREVPEQAASYGALGKFYMKLGRKPEALDLMRRYLERSAPDERDRRYIEQYVKQLESEGTTP